MCGCAEQQVSLASPCSQKQVANLWRARDARGANAAAALSKMQLRNNCRRLANFTARTRTGWPQSPRVSQVDRLRRAYSLVAALPRRKLPCSASICLSSFNCKSFFDSFFSRSNVSTVPVLLHRLIRAALEGRGSGDCCEVWRLAACRADLQVMLQLLPSVGNGRLRLVLHLFSPAEANTRAQIDVEENTASQCTSARNPPAAPCRWQVGRNGSNQSAGGRDGVPRAQQRVGL